MTSSGTQPEGPLDVVSTAVTRANTSSATVVDDLRTPIRERRRPSPTCPERASDLGKCPSWWRGQDLNLRPSGYEPTDRVPACVVWYLVVPLSWGFADPTCRRDRKSVV